MSLERGRGKEGSTAFVDASGQFGARLNFESGDPPPHIAIRLMSDAFTEDKAVSLKTLRHEMLHARHHELTLKSLKRWPKGGGRRNVDTFVAWLTKNPKDLAVPDVDLVLVEEIAVGRGTANTEVLSYVEGFMTAFHLIDPAPAPRDLIFFDLLGVLETTKLLPWASADHVVREEALGRLREYYCDTLDSKHRGAFDAWVKAQEKQADDDRQTLASNSRGADRAGAMARKANWHAHFVNGLKEVVAGACARAKP